MHKCHYGSLISTLFSRWGRGGVWIGSIVVLGVFLAGCGGKSGSTAPTTTLEGMVRLDGQPVPEGTISFVPQEKKQAPPASAKIEAGRYSAQGVPIGKVLVMIRAPKKTGKVIQIPDSKSSYEETLESIPAKYLSGIPLDVTEQTKTKDFDLSSK